MKRAGAAALGSLSWNDRAGTGHRLPERMDPLYPYRTKDLAFASIVRQTWVPLLRG